MHTVRKTIKPVQNSDSVRSMYLGGGGGGGGGGRQSAEGKAGLAISVLTYLMLPVNVALMTPINPLVLHYDIFEHDSTTPVAVDQTLPCNFAALPVGRHVSGPSTQQATT